MTPRRLPAARPLRQQATARQDRRVDAAVTRCGVAIAAAEDACFRLDAQRDADAATRLLILSAAIERALADIATPSRGSVA